MGIHVLRLLCLLQSVHVKLVTFRQINNAFRIVEMDLSLEMKFLMMANKEE